MVMVCCVSDQGLIGTRVPGLVLHWSGAKSEDEGVQGGKLQLLPDGWSTLPHLSWDAGTMGN